MLFFYHSYSTLLNNICPLSCVAWRWKTAMVCGLKNFRSYDATKPACALKGGMMHTNPADNSPFDRLNQRLSALSLQPHDVGGNGDCFFKSISHQMYGAANLHVEVRIAGMNHITSYPELYIESISDSSWENYIKLMSTPGTWCDNVIIQAVANAYNSVIHIIESHIDKPNGTTIVPHDHENPQKILFIGYINGLHYVSTVKIASSPNKNKLKYLKQKLLESDAHKKIRLNNKRKINMCKQENESRQNEQGTKQNTPKNAYFQKKTKVSH